MLAACRRKSIACELARHEENDGRIKDGHANDGAQVADKFNVVGPSVEHYSMLFDLLFVGDIFTYVSHIFHITSEFWMPLFQCHLFSRSISPNFIPNCFSIFHSWINLFLIFARWISFWLFLFLLALLNCHRCRNSYNAWFYSSPTRNMRSCRRAFVFKFITCLRFLLSGQFNL